MKGSKNVISTDIVDVLPTVIVISMMAMAFLTFAYSKLFGSLTGLLHMSVPPTGDILLISVVVALAALPLAFLNVWSGTMLKAVTYLAWLLYLPSALYYSGIDVFRILSISANFSVFTTSLSYTIIAIAGILMACGSLTMRSFGRLRKAREYFLARGADQSETRRAFFHNALFVIKLILATGAATILFAFLAPTIGQKLRSTFITASSTYLLVVLGAILLLALVLVLFLWPRKNGEKG
ncbi:hypothetical protein MCP_1525 [Methanocella paludicola SANAE]|uniref:Uncharacterized protein n=1 Tax=Methanocella paludicola (strain DSM 17711 / JCM 13418 / NBRC 101707 / SANAE) TaxID=304371 RepID=D1YYS5_METPS|nr:hypothetical protein [Methanocella paludicola]BAI61597.1 hypothetical protein MCP_1525 [Methanocella paludicola SANAE]